ncbi:mulatexin-like, partial [Triticum urartu]|uniref:mulatexin-like n=1 Tax=Triticum urartu TaxID=4572 RepID=UPI002044CCED
MVMAPHPPVLLLLLLAPLLLCSLLPDAARAAGAEDTGVTIVRKDGTTCTLCASCGNPCNPNPGYNYPSPPPPAPVTPAAPVYPPPPSYPAPSG